MSHLLQRFIQERKRQFILSILNSRLLENRISVIKCDINYKGSALCAIPNHEKSKLKSNQKRPSPVHKHTTKCSSVNSSMLCTGVTCFGTFSKTTQMSLSVLRGHRGIWWPSTLAVAQKQDGVKDSPNALHFINISFHTSLPTQESQVNWCSEERMRERLTPEKCCWNIYISSQICVYIPLMKSDI